MIEFPGESGVSCIADWVELHVVYDNRSISKSRLLVLWQAQDGNISEEDVDSVIGELIRRERLYGASAGFEVDGKIVRPRITGWTRRPEIIMCLIFSLYGVRRRRGHDDGTKLFERLSREAVASYLEGEAVVIGFPGARRLREQIENTARAMGEEIGQRVPRPQDKDKGVDIIAWKSHEDTRSNQVVVLLQCGAGFNFDHKKAISLRAWHEFIRFSADPLSGIIIPRIVQQGEEWTEIRDDYGLVFDRVRIGRAIHKQRSPDRRLKIQIARWCREQLN